LSNEALKNGIWIDTPPETQKFTTIKNNFSIKFSKVPIKISLAYSEMPLKWGVPKIIHLVGF